jgi:hypothetical protein
MTSPFDCRLSEQLSAVAYDVFFPRKHSSGFPSMSHRFPRAPFSVTHDLPGSFALWAIPSISQIPNLLDSR